MNSELNSAESATPTPAQFWMLCGLAFLFLGGHAIARPATESLFLQQYSSRLLPWVWLLEAVVAVGMVGVLNRAIARTPIAVIFDKTTLGSAISLVGLLAAYQLHLPGAAFVLYIWKDIYVVLLVEIFWILANIHYPIRSASRTYGLFCAAGTVGSLAGGVIVAPVAERFGTLTALWCVLPTLVFTLWGAKKLHMSPAFPQATTADKSLVRDLGILKQSSYIVLLALLIAVIQLVSNLVDLQFNQMVEATYPLLDKRTAMIGWVYAAIAVVALVLQLVTGSILRILGIATTLLIIPLMLLGFSGVFLVWTSITTITIVKTAGKSFDYSIFRAAKEILYIPLSYREKTAGKTVVDVLSYRVAKGIASVLILALGTAATLTGITYVVVGLLALWLLLTVAIVRRFHYQKQNSPSDAA